MTFFNVIFYIFSIKFTFFLASIISLFCTQDKKYLKSEIDKEGRRVCDCVHTMSYQMMLNA